MALVLARCAAVALGTLQAASLRCAASGFTPTQIHIRAMRSQLSRAKKLRIVWRDTFVCHMCGKRGWWQTMEVEHVQALAQRGGNQDCNLKAAHMSLWCLLLN